MGLQEQSRMRKVQQKLRMRGLTLNLEALRCVVAYLSNFHSHEDDVLDQIASELDKLPLKSAILGKEGVLEVLSLLSGSSNYGQSALRIVNVFKIPKFCYDPIRKQFHQTTDKLAIHGEANSKAALYRDRLQLLQQRLARDKHFAKPALNIEGTRTGTCEMTPIQSLMGCVGRRWIMGVISQLEDGCFFLEDLSSSIPIDISEAKITSGFFVENTIIVAEGEMLSVGTFKVYTCGFPPLESRAVSLSVTAGLDFFGGGILAAEETERLARMEKKALNDMFVILSDVWIDQQETLEKLNTILDGYESVDVVPSLFILMGNFCSRPCNLAFHAFSELKTQFGKLGSMIAAHPRIMENSKFLFIPGPEDIGPANVIPRPALPAFFSKEVIAYVPNAIFSSNPCRVRFYTQEIVLFRQDLLYRMRRACLIPPSEEETADPFEHLVATITHQSHLCPLPLTTQPIIWNYDHTLRLYPTPDTIVLADSSEQKSFKYSGVTCFNPGSFANDGTFIAYRPATKEVELSGL